MDERIEGELRTTAFPKVAKLGIALALMLGIGFAGGVTVGAAGGNGSSVFSNLPLLGDGLDATPDESADMATFWKAWNTLQDRFVAANSTSTPPSSKEKLWGAIQGMAASYGDPYTVFMPPEEAKRFEDDIRGDFEGVGMEVGIKDGILTIIAPLKGTPAARAGLQSGDKIIAIDDKSTEGMSTDEAVKLIRGEKGTTVTFMIVRDEERLEVPVVRDTIQVPTIETELDAENSVFIISFYSFTANSADLFAKAMQGFRNSGARHLLIDVRGNPGGYLESAVAISGHFLPNGSLVVTEDYQGKRENVEHRTRSRSTLPEGTRVAVLMDQGSASASEILAGALQDADVATLIGARSFGKGSVQELVHIDEGALKVTVARWLTPSGRSISDGGLTPDIEVPMTREDREAGEDPQKARAIEFVTTGN